MEIHRGVTFRYYGMPVSIEVPEVTVEDGIISHNIPDEIGSVEQAKAYAAALLKAAEELQVEQMVRPKRDDYTIEECNADAMRAWWRE